MRRPSVRRRQVVQVVQRRDRFVDWLRQQLIQNRPYDEVVRKIVSETGLAIGTVRKAIRTLIDEGLVYTRPGHGTFVTGEEPRQSLPGGAPFRPH